jgi:hypothetical protein
MKRVAAFVLLAVFAGAQLAPSESHHVSFAPPKKTAVAAGRPAVIEFDFRVSQGLHINSNVPKSEFLIPTKLRFMPPTDIAVGKVEYPAGEELALSFSPKEKLSVYTGDFKVKAQVSASRSATTGPYTVHGELKYQACNDKACFPPKTLPIAFNIVVEKARPGTGGVTQEKAPAAPGKKNPPQSPHIKPR